MTTKQKGLLLPVGMIVAGTLAFLVFLGVTGDADEGHSMGLLDWIVAGALIGPGFATLIRWRQARDR